jgi:hypothetical protein
MRPWILREYIIINKFGLMIESSWVSVAKHLDE